MITVAGNNGVKGISRDLLKLIMEASKSTHPHEFAALLRAEKGVINEILLVPGTASDEDSAIMMFHMMPIDRSIVGSVHSHPVHDLRYSDADIHMFGSKGTYNIIVAYPYMENDWVCYNPRGERVAIPVVDEPAGGN
ncbi:Mov34/MPN/PAD-1 family protein [Methanocella arvoryzae]|uniref:Predicted protease (Mov34 family) n=1 Tax=Methanocella arvoryzae (strain DSM 22066 / NBRC 105507 / MRE50) TaxID=351160 RepID=Q0W934_METAR|nr:Mov34/MPN/PAD-1 family protein [Methanocella arvoryzae]CAJ35092.1 predicted protease (Mov34 family) [Methanocella arvoryzae MRE50]